MEQVSLRSCASQAKIIGAILSISGALVIVLYKGPKVFSGTSYTPSPPTISLDKNLTSPDSSWMIGGLLLASQYFFLSVWYILQVQTLGKFIKKKRLYVFLNSVAVSGFRLGLWRHTLKKLA